MNKEINTGVCTGRKLKNKTERENFINNYKAWGIWKEVPELEMKYYRYVLPDGTQIIVSVHQCRFYDYQTKTNKDRASIKYHLVVPQEIKWPDISYTNGNEFKHFNPNGCGISTVVKYLTDTKPEV